jgi:hypothetical protein
MAQQTINVGSAPNDGQGDPVRTAFIKCNDNFTELYDRVQQSVPSSPTGAVGDTAGMMAFDNQYLYICVADFDDTTEIWRRVAFDTSW